MRTIQLFILIVIASFSSKSDPLPTKYFASAPDVSSVQLSPDGQRIVSLIKVDTPERRGKIIQLYDLSSGEKNNLAYSDGGKYKVRSLAWASDRYIIIYADFPASRYGVPTTESRVLKLDTVSGNISAVVPRKILKDMTWFSNDLDNIIDYLPEDDDALLISMAGFAGGGEESVLKISLSGKRKSVFLQRNKKHVQSWITDSAGNVRVGVAESEAKYKIIERRTKQDEWRTLWEFDAFSEDAVWPIAFDETDNVLYVSALYQGRDAIYSVDLTDAQLSKKLIHSDERYDVGGRLRKSKKTGEVIGIGNFFWHPKWSRFQASIDKALPETNNHIISLSDDENRYIMLATSDVEPGMYLFGDRKAGTLDLLAYRYKNLTPEVLSAKQAISYNARDGLKIEGFLTLPKGNRAENLPTIVFPHGGPISFDDDGFDYWTQFLANQGYAVLQMNFRGSSGYGHDFMKQGLANWGQAMQDDIEDGTNWLIEQGIADKNRVCIVGASYGGYAALMGGIKTPELYQCIVSFAGVTDLEYLVEKPYFYTSHDIVKKQIGSDDDKLFQNSPVNFANKITKPVLLLHGEKDRVVRLAHSEKMLSALRKKGKHVKYVELEGGDHYLSNSENRFNAFNEIEEFLNKHNPAE